MIGMTRVTVTRQIGALIRDGIIGHDKRHLIVLHPDRLNELAQLPCTFGSSHTQVRLPRRFGRNLRPILPPVCRERYEIVVAGDTTIPDDAARRVHRFGSNWIRICTRQEPNRVAVEASVCRILPCLWQVAVGRLIGPGLAHWPGHSVIDGPGRRRSPGGPVKGMAGANQTARSIARGRGERHDWIHRRFRAGNHLGRAVRL